MARKEISHRALRRAYFERPFLTYGPHPGTALTSKTTMGGFDYLFHYKNLLFQITLVKITGHVRL